MLIFSFPVAITPFFGVFGHPLPTRLIVPLFQYLNAVNTMKTISTCLAFNDQAEEAVNFYIALFPNSRILDATPSIEGAPAPAGRPMAISFELNGREYLALNGGSYFTFSEGMSLLVVCETQQEIDEYWAKLSEGGQTGPCGWLKDKFGVSWQVAPHQLDEMLLDKDTTRAKRVFEAMCKMSKIDLGELQRAYNEELVA